ncbi:uncharacterized protein LOC135951555 [Calliphora vicina]|uniref:uncharacterized protein LOC135951555 n=1 Tax=Calliphora vicina TaxID=7373 RepID=UPI00325AE167
MTSYKIFTILVVSLLMSAQLALAKPAATQADHFKDYDLCKLKSIHAEMAPSENDSDLPPTLQLMKMIAYDLQDISLSFIKKAKDISDQLLKESVLNTNQSPEMKKFKQDVEEFNNKYSKCSDVDELYDLVQLFSNATSEYYEKETNGTLTADTKIILDVLKKHSTKEMEDEMEKKYINSLVVSFGEKLDELKEKLKTEEGELGEKILQWWDKVKALKTPEEKVAAFKEYMTLYGYEED